MSKDVKWLGQTVCDICKQEIHGHLYDARTRFRVWAVMCEDCYQEVGCIYLGADGEYVKKLGVGMGQKYCEASGWKKVEG